MLIVKPPPFFFKKKMSKKNEKNIRFFKILTFLMTSVRSPASSSSGVGGRGLLGAPPLLDEGPGKSNQLLNCLIF